MNSITAAKKMLDQAQKAKNRQKKYLNDLKDSGVDITNLQTPEEAYDITLQNLRNEWERVEDLAIELQTSLMKKLKEIKNIDDNQEKWYMISIRPPHDTPFAKFKKDIEIFIDKWKYKWLECVYVFEQKGETLENLGFGAHAHIRILTNCINYYPSHIKRDVQKTLTYINIKCIDCQFVKNYQRCVEYMAGDKNDENKNAAAIMDPIWREKIGIPSEVKVKARMAIEEITQ